MIQNKFIDYTQATARAIRAFRDTEEILETYPGHAEEIDCRLHKLSGANVSSAPVHGGSSRAEDNWAHCLDQKELLLKKVEQAEEYFAWFMPAWNRLTDSERTVLEEHYIRPGTNGSWTKTACGLLHIERSAIYEINKKALMKLSGLLTWPGLPQ